MFDRTERLALTALGTILALTLALIVIRTGSDSATATDTATATATATDTDTDTATDTDTRTVPPLPRHHALVDDLLRESTASIAWNHRRFEQNPTQWLDLETIARSHMLRAHLTGDFSEYAVAEHTLTRAFEIAPDPAGPILTAAELEQTVHRLDRAERQIDVYSNRIVPLNHEERAVADGLRGDVAFHRGRYQDAYTLYRSVWGRRQTMRDAFRLAQWHWRMGDVRRADAFLNEAQRRAAFDPEAVAWLLLQRGRIDLERAQPDVALRRFRDADRLFRGWYLIEQHIADALAVLGRTDEAEAQYRATLARRPEVDLPEVRDALATVLRARGDAAGAAEMARTAREGWERLLALYPEAAYGHAVRHWLDHENDPARTLELAEANRHIRPNGEALTLLARAYLQAGRTDDAARVAAQALASGWRSAELYEVLVDVAEEQGDHAAARAHREAAAALRDSASRR